MAHHLKAIQEVFRQRCIAAHCVGDQAEHRKVCALGDRRNVRRTAGVTANPVIQRLDQLASPNPDSALVLAEAGQFPRALT